MILADCDIEQYAREGMIEPWEPAQLQPASYDCTLGNSFQVFESHRMTAVNLRRPETYEGMSQEVVVPDDGEFVIQPSEFVLGSTREYFSIPVTITGRIEGKSSLGRLGLQTHVTAGFFDPGYCGHATLEFVNLLSAPIVLTPGLLICQMSFIQLTQPARTPYKGRYQGDRGAVASRYRPKGEAHV